MGFLKKAAITVAALATLVGTCYSPTESFPFIFTKKTSTTGGICASLITTIEEGATFHGVVTGLFAVNNGTVNGVYAPLFSVGSAGGTVNGLELTLVEDATSVPLRENASERGYMTVNGVSISIGGYLEEMNGAQVILGGGARRLDGFHLAVVGLAGDGKNVQTGAVLGSHLDSESGSYSHWGLLAVYNRSD